MPKVVDHDQRRRELARAVWQVVREHGVEGASVRAVARRAGWSPSSVQYYFASQAELLAFAMRTIEETAEQRLTEADVPAEPGERAVTLLERLLPLDADAYTATELWVAFVSRALIDPATRAHNTASNERLAGLIGELLQHLAAAGLLARDVDLDLEAGRLHALFDGIALHAVTDPGRMPPSRASALLRHHLDTLVAGNQAARS